MQYWLDDPESALKYWNMFLKYHSDNHDVRLYAGLALAELGRYSDALARLENIPQEYPDINIHRGDVYASMDLHDRAIGCYRKGLAANPDNSHAHEVMGVSYAGLEDYRKALECFDRAIGIRSNYRVYYNKGTALVKLGRYDDAIVSYRKALAANPHDLETRINLASALSDSGDRKRPCRTSLQPWMSILIILSHYTAWGLLYIAWKGTARRLSTRTKPQRCIRPMST